MYQVQNLTSGARQKQTLVLEDGTNIQIQIRFSPMQYGWFIDSISYGDFILKGARIVNSPNMLHQWRNKIPFGLACFSAHDREPSLQKDFSSGASKLYVLTQAEVEQFTSYLNGQI